MSVIDRAKHSQEVLRKQRVLIFKAFDIYKTNVEYGIIEETQEQHDDIISWYQKCLDLDYNAINNVPECIKRYLQN